MRLFYEAYDRLVERWAVPLEPLELESEFGVTRVLACGGDGGSQDTVPLVLLHGGRINSAAWFGVAAALSAGRRVYAVDTMGDPGRSVPGGRAVRGRADLLAWLEETWRGLGLDTGGADLCGHSFGAWLGLAFALRRHSGGGEQDGGAGVRRLALLDPTQCFAGFSAACLWHALPVALGRGNEAYLRWETCGAEIDPQWRELERLGAAMPTGKLVAGRRPKPELLRDLKIPVLVLTAERSRVHDTAKVAARARALLPEVTVAELPGVSHHMIPTERPGELARRLIEFFEG